MSPDEQARQDAEWDAFRDDLMKDPQFAAYLDARRNAERRRLGLPIIEYKRKGQEE